VLSARARGVAGFAEGEGDGAAELDGIVGVAHQLDGAVHGLGAGSRGEDAGAQLFHLGEGLEEALHGGLVEPGGELADREVRVGHHIAEVLVLVEEVLANVGVLLDGEVGRRREIGGGVEGAGGGVLSAESWVLGRERGVGAGGCG
jgi:hypothetical protein